MLIERHISWLAVNNVVGCPNKCKYCFLGKDKLTNTKPEIKANAEESIDKLINYPYYKKDIPVALMINTDAFSTESNKEELFKLLDVINEKQLPNLFVLVTKREITEEDCIKLKKFIDGGNKLVVYVSYSGLDKDFEKGIRKNGRLESLITIDNLYSFGIPCVHYWRPIMKQNSSIETLYEVCNNVKDKCIASVVSGLKLYPYMVNECSKFWKEATECYNKNPDCECIFPKGSLEYIQKLSKIFHYPVFIDNVCCLSMIQNKPCNYGLYKSSRCLYYNKCSLYQRNLCKQYYNDDYPKVEVLDDNISFENILDRIEKTGHHLVARNNEYWNSSLTNSNWKEV